MVNLNFAEFGSVEKFNQLVINFQRRIFYHLMKFEFPMNVLSVMSLLIETSLKLNLRSKNLNLVKSFLKDVAIEIKVFYKRFVFD